MVQSPSCLQSPLGGANVGKSLRSLVSALEQLRTFAENLVDQHESEVRLQTCVEAVTSAATIVSPARSLRRSHEARFGFGKAILASFDEAPHSSKATASPPNNSTIVSFSPLRASSHATEGHHQQPLAQPAALTASPSPPSGCKDRQIKCSLLATDDEPNWPDTDVPIRCSKSFSTGSRKMQDSGTPNSAVGMKNVLSSSFGASASLMNKNLSLTTSHDGKALRSVFFQEHKNGRTEVKPTWSMTDSAQSGDGNSATTLSQWSECSKLVLCAGESLKAEPVQSISGLKAETVQSISEEFSLDESHETCIQELTTTLREVWLDVESESTSQSKTPPMVSGQRRRLRDVEFVVEVQNSPEQRLLTAATTRMLQQASSRHSMRFTHHASLQKGPSTSRHFDKSDQASCMLHPFGWFSILWCCCSVIIVFYDLLFLTMEAFPLPDVAISAHDRISFVCSIYWSLDVIVNFRTGIMINMSLEYRPLAIAKHYAMTWLPLDLFILCCEWVGRFLGRRVWTIKFFKLWKLLRIMKLPHLCCLIEEKVHVSALMRMFLLMVKMTIGLGIGIHLATCGWYAMGSAYPDGWTKYIDIPPCGTLPNLEELESEPEGEITMERTMMLYFVSCRWVLAQVNGRTDQDARRNIVEMVYTCICAVLGPLLAMSVFVSFITSTMMELSAIAQENRARRQLVDEYVGMHRIHPELTALVKHHVRAHNDLSKQTELENKLLDLLPNQLKKDVVYEVRAPFLAAHPFFKILNSNFPSSIRDICMQALLPMVVKQGEKIFERGDACTRMIFAYKGKFMYSQKPTRRREQHEQQAPLDESCVVESKALIDDDTDAVKKGPQFFTGVWLSEAALWIEWCNHGKLFGISDGCLYALEYEAFADGVRTYRDVLSVAAKYAMAFHQAVRKNGHLSDILDISVIHENADETSGSVAPNVFRSAYTMAATRFFH